MILVRYFNGNMHHVSCLLSELCPYGFEDTDQIGDSTVSMLDSHVDNAAIIGKTVKCGMHAKTTLPEFPAEIPWKQDVGSAMIGFLLKNRVIFEVPHGSFLPYKLYARLEYTDCI